MELIVIKEQGGTRIDKLISEAIHEISRSQAEKIDFKVNGVAVKKKFVCQEGDVITFELPEQIDSTLKPIKEKLEKVYEDNDILCLNKPPNLPVHPDTKGSHERTLVNLLLGNKIPLSSLGGNDRPGIVHRLDKDTSGLILVAKSNEAYKHLRELFEAKQIKKTYIAMTVDTIANKQGVIDSPIGRDARDRKKMSVRAGTAGKDAITNYTVTEIIKSAKLNYSLSLLKVHIPTGRTHQIRVHLSAINHPIIGDEVYGNKKANTKALDLGLDRQFLHAHELTFTNLEGESITLKSELPEDLQAFLTNVTT